MLLMLLMACRVEVGAPGATTSSDGPVELWVYTSMYEEVIEGLEPLVERDLPEITVKWYQAGSEKVAQRLEAEWEAGGSQACVLMTSDPFWYGSLAQRGKLRDYVSPRALDLDPQWVSPSQTTARLSTMVLGVHGEMVPEADRPRSFDDLLDPRFKDQISMPDPLSSGTTFTTMAFLQDAGGWEWFKSAKANGMVAAGGNSSTLQRIETGERPVGVLLLENILKAQTKGSPVVAIFPEDGAVAIPGPVATTAECRHPLAAQAFTDFILSPDAQAQIVSGYMHSPFAGAAPPAGAPPIEDIALKPWSAEFVAKVAADAGAMKDTYAGIVTGG